MIPETYRDKKVLVVEDTQMMRVLMVRHLKQAGFKEVKECIHGGQAMEILDQETIDLILLDINMPEMDGYATLTAIRANERIKHIPVIMITAVDNIESVARCIEIGADDYMPKLFNPILLNSRIRQCLELRELRKQLGIQS